MHSASLGGADSLYSMLQMPPGIPVATVAIDGGRNAGLLALRILAVSDPDLCGKLKAYRQTMQQEVQKKDQMLQETGYARYKK
jgi:5-(carboxyamino)imidazole ribonucleotide mutase